MPLPIIESHHVPQPADLIRYYLRTESHRVQHLAEPETLEVGTAFANPQLPLVRDANQIMEVSLPPGKTSAQAIELVDAHFAAIGVRCYHWTMNPSAAAAQIQPLVEHLLLLGYKPHIEDVLYLRHGPRTVIETGGLTIIPARASYRHMRQLIEEDVARWGPEALEQLIEAGIMHLDDPHVDALLALRDGVPVGSVELLAVGELGCITSLYVSEGFRRQGIGRTMMSRALEIAARSLFKHLFLSVAPENEPAQRLYSALGFQKVGQVTVVPRSVIGPSDSRPRGLLLRLPFIYDEHHGFALQTNCTRPPMIYRSLGNTGWNVSQLGFGAMRLPMVGEGKAARVDRDKALPMLNHAFDAGLNYIDSAAGYCNGDSETVIGEAIKGRRERIIVSTKNPYYGDDEKQWWTHLETSLKRLQVDSIDIYNHHGLGWKKYIEIIEPRIGQWMRKALDQKLIKHSACSFHDNNQALRDLVDSGYVDVITLQYNMLDRQLEDGIAYAHQKGVGIVVMGPVAGGAVEPRQRPAARHGLRRPAHPGTGAAFRPVQPQHLRRPLRHGHDADGRGEPRHRLRCHRAFLARQIRHRRSP